MSESRSRDPTPPPPDADELAMGHSDDAGDGVAAPAAGSREVRPAEAAERDASMLKDRALELMEAAEHTLPATTTRRWTAAAVGRLLRALGDADASAAGARVAAMRRALPAATPDELAERLIRSACQRTALVGAATSGAAIVPGLGTIASVTLGTTADLAATLRLQAQMVLEIAAAHDFPLQRMDNRAVMLVVTGVGAGGNLLLESAGQRVGTRLGERLAGRWVAHALPVLGVAASAGTNVLSTYVIGRRTVAYVREGPEAVGDWAAGVRAVTGLDERRIGAWLAEGGRRAVDGLAEGSRRASGAGAGVLLGAGRVASAGARSTASGLRSVGASLVAGMRRLGRARRSGHGGGEHPGDPGIATRTPDDPASGLPVRAEGASEVTAEDPDGRERDAPRADGDGADGDDVV